METSGRHGRRGRTCFMAELTYSLRRHRLQKKFHKKTYWSWPTAHLETAVVNDQTERIGWEECVPRLVLQLQILSRTTQTLAKLQIHKVFWKNSVSAENLVWKVNFLETAQEPDSSVSWSDSAREQSVPSGEDAIMEDCTESHQSEIYRKIKANDKLQTILWKNTECLFYGYSMCEVCHINLKKKLYHGRCDIRNK